MYAIPLFFKSNVKASFKTKKNNKMESYDLQNAIEIFSSLESD